MSDMPGYMDSWTGAGHPKVHSPADRFRSDYGIGSSGKASPSASPTEKSSYGQSPSIKKPSSPARTTSPALLRKKAPEDEKAPPSPFRDAKSGRLARKPSDETLAGFKSKEAPTGLAAEPLNIIILGASFGGLSCAHHFLDVTLDQLSKTKKAGINYRIILVGPSTHIYWNIGAPRALVRPGLMKIEDQFINIEPGFYEGDSKQTNRVKNLNIIQGRCVSMDAASRTVSIECTDPVAQTRLASISPKNAGYRPQVGKVGDLPVVQALPYHALIMCTGTSARSELLSLHGNYTRTASALDRIHAQIQKGKSIVVCGGGCSGVEVAGQLATYLNYKRHFPFRIKSENPKQITLLSGGDRLLKEIAELGKPEVSKKAERLLTKLGVVVKHGIRVKSTESWFDQTGATRITFEDGTQHITDVYIDCTGVEPNSDYAPESIKTSDGYINTNTKTMRVDTAGERVYAIGDVASYSQNYVLDVYHGIPIVMQNLLNDLLIYQWKSAAPYADHSEKIAKLEQEEFQPSPKNSQICPITKFGGVGILAGLTLPQLGVHYLKGRNYVVHKAKKVVVDGGNPYSKPGMKYD